MNISGTHIPYYAILASILIKNKGKEEMIADCSHDWKNLVKRISKKYPRKRSKARYDF